MKKDHYAPGEPCWIDCGTDVAKAKSFYSSLFGWTVNELGPEAGGYAMAQMDGETVAALGPQQSPGHPFWSVYFCVHDVNKTAETVRANGGTVMVEPMDVMGEGHMAVFADPVGAAFSIWQPGNTKGLGEVGGSGQFCWAELITTDLDASKKFYAEVFGWGAKEGSDNSMEYTEFQLGVTSIAGMMLKPEMMPAEVPPFWGVYFAVDDADESVAKCKELGGAMLSEPMDIPTVGRFAPCADPLGAVFSVLAPSAE
jgi:hypothetical protein